MIPRIAIPVPHSDRDYALRALKQYEDAIRNAGGEPIAIPLEWSNQQIADVAKRCDAVLLPGSKADIDPQKYGAATRHPLTAPADPARDNVDELLLQDAFNMRKPVLGICYGLQALNVWRTGTLVQHIESHSQGHTVTRAHQVTLEPASLLAEIIPADEPLWVNSSHHQAADVIGDGLRVVARAVAKRPEEQIIEAVEGTAPDHFVLGLQWHPERTFQEDEPSRAIFRTFMDAARHRHQQPRAPVQDFESLSR